MNRTDQIQLQEAITGLRDRVRECLAECGNPAQWDFDVFISYRQAESKSLALRLYESLRRGRHPSSGRGLRVFLDVAVIKPGQNVHMTLQKAIRRSTCFLVLMTRTYNTTEYTSFEQMLIAGMDPAGLQERIIPLLLEDCEIPKRLQPIQYLDLRNAHREDGNTAVESGRSTIRLHYLEVPQSVVTNALARRLDLANSLVGFKLREETGDLVPDGAFLELKNGVRVSFSSEDIECAILDVCRDVAGSLVDAGFVMSGCVVKGFQERRDSKEELPDDAPVCILLEKLDGRTPELSTEALTRIMESYAFDLPRDFDRSSLNALPRPSPCWEVLEELIRREAWEPLKTCIREVASVAPGIATLWIAEVVQARNGIEDAQFHAEIDAAATPDAAEVRIWAERLLDSWSV